MRAKKYVVACILFCALMLCGTTIVVPAKENEIKDNGEYRYRELNRNDDYRIYTGKQHIDCGKGICLLKYLGDQEDVTVPDEIDGKPVVVIAWGCFKENAALQKVTIPATVKIVGGFQKCTNLSSVNMTEGVLEISEDAFNGCTALEKIDMPDSVVVIGSGSTYCWSFSDCTSLKEIRFSKNLELVRDSAFRGCTSLERVELPEKLGYVPDGCFSGCTALKEVTIPENYRFVGSSAFYGCTSLKEITLPEQMGAIGSAAFAGCTALEHVAIPEPVTEIDMRTFDGCTSLKTVNLPSSVTKIDDGAFLGCTSLTKIKLPAQLKTIGTDAFRGAGLHGITVPAKVTSIGRRAFAHCSSMKKVVFKGKSTKISALAFKGIAPKAVFDVPNSSIKMYRSRLAKNTGFLAKSMKIV